MILKIGLYISLSLFGIGLLYRISSWFRYKIGSSARDISTLDRIVSSVKGIITTLFSLKFINVMKTLIFDVFLQRKIIRKDFLRWFMHLFIYLGFTLLVLMHALQSIITSKLFPDYYSTINPYMFLRDLFGIMVIVGLFIAVYRRFILKVPRLATNSMDVYLIAMVGIIILTGIFLEGVKITSYTRYREMATDYGAAENAAESKALESYWVKNFYIISPEKKLIFDTATLKLGKNVHERTCSSCHSNPRWAFSGFIIAGMIKPVAAGIDAAGIPIYLYYIHYIACLFALAYFPFSKSFHIIATPISLLANAVIDEDKSNPANIATKRVIELDACMHCGTCSHRCSALAAASGRNNSDILPSEKMQHLKSMIRGKKLDAHKLALLREGVYLCTSCDRCTVVCPAGINLRELWFQAREELIHAGNPIPFILSPLSHYRGLMKDKLSEEYYVRPLNTTINAVTSTLHDIKNRALTLSVSDMDLNFMNEAGLSVDASTCSSCFSCSTCTSSCPVVQSYDNPLEKLGLLPHQIIHSTILGLKELALGSNMLWDCLTCYKCQENCPQKVCIMEVFYRLKNIAAARVIEADKEYAGSTV
jgi:heterodisulfide reductase subunit C/nitrate reductase gamma subunit